MSALLLESTPPPARDEARAKHLPLRAGARRKLNPRRDWARGVEQPILNRILDETALSPAVLTEALGNHGDKTGAEVRTGACPLTTGEVGLLGLWFFQRSAPVRRSRNEVLRRQIVGVVAVLDAASAERIPVDVCGLARRGDLPRAEHPRRGDRDVISPVLSKRRVIHTGFRCDRLVHDDLSDPGAGAARRR